MFATDKPTCPANVVLSERSEDSRWGAPSVACRCRMPSVSPCARIGMHKYVFFTPAACAHGAVESPATTRCGCPVRKAQQDDGSKTAEGSWQSLHEPITSATLREASSNAIAPGAAGNIFGA